MDTLQMLSFGDTGWGLALSKAIGMTLLLTVSLLVGAVFGSLVAAAKLSRRSGLRWLGDAYLVLFRGVPELLVIYLFYFGGATVVSAVGHWFGATGYIGMPPFWWAHSRSDCFPALTRLKSIVALSWQSLEVNWRRPWPSAWGDSCVSSAC